MIVGVAGHVDHGKTALVHALTGVATDRTPEEKRRGITVELGFAALRLDSGELISMVDVPGHETLVRTMVAGASGIDAAIVVVAADEGVMPQTREHLRVLSALGVKRGIVVLTKCDLVDQEWISLVTEDVRAALASSSLPGVQIIAASSRTSAGIPAVVSALASLAQSAPVRLTHDLFRFVVDRAFTMQGTGTVVTGTVWSGQLRVGESVTLLPKRSKSRVRGIQSHGLAISTAGPGTRCALALADAEPSAVPHGTQLVTDNAWSETRMICADVTMARSGSAATGKPQGYLLYIAGSEVRARISAIGSTPPGGPAVHTVDTHQTSRVKIRLDRPIFTRRGDRFVLRAASPPDTVGGGVIVDPMPDRGQRGAWTDLSESTNDRLSALLSCAGIAGIAATSLPLRLGVPPSQVDEIVTRARGRQLGPNVFSTGALGTLTDDLVNRAAAWQSSHPLDDGLALAKLREELRAPPEAIAWAIDSLCADGQYRVQDGIFAPSKADRALSESDTDLLARLLHRICDAAKQPPTTAELAAEFGSRSDALLRFAARRGNLVAVESVRYYDSRVVADQIGRLHGEMQPGREYSPQELREFLGVSRKYLIPFLEYCDNAGVTVRHPSGRTIRGISSQ